ncbi:hydrogen maturase HydG, mitochondrial [Pelomyxa schiedti]|nr:hydrogen maturase HydG, mitochondrial [Pelomyxa schiedti]
MLGHCASLSSPLFGALSSARVLSRTPFVRKYTPWSVEKEPHVLPKVSDIIKEDEIHKILRDTKPLASDKGRIRSILDKAKDRATLKLVKTECKSEYVQGLDLDEVATLLNIDPEKNPDLMQELYNTALQIKRQVYGNRIVLFAPLYLSNYCINSCTYCAFRGPNIDLHRAKLSREEIIAEAQAIQRVGHKRVLVLCGESPKYTFDDFLDSLNLVKSVRTPPHGEFRRINVEIPSLSVSDFRRLKATNCVGTYTLFQETYHRPSYHKFHPYGPKADYDNRVLTFDRAQIAKVDDVGIGALFGLYDHRFEVLAMFQQAAHLEKTYGAGPHTISIPRMQPALNAPTSAAPPYPVDDAHFKQLVATIRCAVPYTGMILSTRESPSMRKQLLQMGVSQMSAGSRTEVGSYHKGDDVSGDENLVNRATQQNKQKEKREKDSDGQFTLMDERPAREVIADLLQDGYIPSWCTACYRMGRTGEAFMAIAKRGDISNFCHPNSLLTLREYLEDYASPEVKKIGEKVIERELANIPDAERRESTENKLTQIETTPTRDLYF